MAESKKKRSSTVRTRVVSSDEPTKNKATTKKATKSTKADTSTKKGAQVKQTAAKKTTLRDRVANRKQQKAANEAANSQQLGYLKGAWYELKQVRWPDRKATWSLTVAVIIFTAFFVVLILLLDAVFKYLFDLVIK